MDYLNCKNLPEWAQILLGQKLVPAHQADNHEKGEKEPQHEEAAAA